jgi:hypothetical protein
MIEEQTKIMNDIIFLNEPGIMCLPCEDEAQTGDLWNGFMKERKNSGGKGVLGCAPQSLEAGKKSGGKGVLGCAPQSLEADDSHIDVYSDEGFLQGLLPEGTLGHDDESEVQATTFVRARECSQMGSIKPLRTPKVGMNLDGSIQPWLVSADEGSRSDTIKPQHPQGTRTLPKPELQSEHRGPGKITAAALQIFGRDGKSASTTTSGTYLPEVLHRACRNYEKLHNMEAGSATEERVDSSSLTVAGWADTHVAENDDIDWSRHCREADMSVGGCVDGGSSRELHPLIERAKEGLNSFETAEWVLIDVIAVSGACETVMPKGLCPNISLRESQGSRSGVEYEVASGKAVPNLGEKHCEIFCEGAASSMMMHFQVADIHRPLLSLSRAADQGFKSHLDWYGGYLEDVKTGETIPIQRRGNLYIMQIWVRGSADNRPPDPSSGFARRG